MEEAKLLLQAEYFRNRLRKRYRHLGKWARRTGVEAYRLYDREIPEVPLRVDIYGSAATVSYYSSEGGGEWLSVMADIVCEVTGIARDLVFLKERKRQREQYQRLGSTGRLLEVREGGLVFLVNLSDYIDTGFYIDRRRLRSLIQKEAAGLRVLNLYAYTAAFSVCAAAGGARQVDSVDLSATYLAWAAENFARNGFRAVLLRPEEIFRPFPFRLFRSDAAAFLDRASRLGLQWDLIILDPPAFSNSKKTRGSFDLKRDQGALLQRCLRALAPGGRLYLSAAAKGFSLDRESLGTCTAADISESLRDEDFRSRRIPVTFRIEH
jgi:23S rRNA G2069 N7-methylase RlmK/C1962 C5-methylase RlmI